MICSIRNYVMARWLYYSPSLFNTVKRNLRDEREGCRVFDLKIPGFIQPVEDTLARLLSLQLLGSCAVDSDAVTEVGVGVN